MNELIEKVIAGESPAKLVGSLTENVGRTILDQISALDKWALGAWGSMGRGRITTFKAGQDIAVGVFGSLKGNIFPTSEALDELNQIVGPHRGGVILKVNGPKLKNGFVIIALTGADLYKIVTGHVRKDRKRDPMDFESSTHRWVTADELDGVFWDMLVDVLNRRIG